jgi:hypothetical protein
LFYGEPQRQRSKGSSDDENMRKERKSEREKQREGREETVRTRNTTRNTGGDVSKPKTGRGG